MTSLEGERAAPATTRTRALVVLVSVLAALSVWLISSLLLSSDVTVPDSPGSSERHPLGAADVLLTATVAALAGWSLLAVLERVTAGRGPPGRPSLSRCSWECFPTCPATPPSSGSSWSACTRRSLSRSSSG